MIIRKYGRYSIFGWLNVLICQFLFFRIEAQAKVLQVEFDGQCIYRLTGVAIIFPIVPLTGWVNHYVPQHFKRIFVGKQDWSDK